MKKTPLELAKEDIKNMMNEGEVVWGKFGERSKKDYIPPKSVNQPIGSNAGSFNHWHDNNVNQKDSSTLTFADAYTDYSRHSYRHGIEPMSVQKFKTSMNDQGYIVQNIAGRARYIGIGLKKN